MFEQLLLTLVNKRKYQRKIEDYPKNRNYRKNIICVARKVYDKLDDLLSFSFHLFRILKLLDISSVMMVPT